MEMLTIACIHCNWSAILLLPLALWVLSKFRKNHKCPRDCHSSKKSSELLWGIDTLEILKKKSDMTTNIKNTKSNDPLNGIFKGFMVLDGKTFMVLDGKIVEITDEQIVEGFRNCNTLTSFHVPESVTSVTEAAFSNLSNNN